MINFVMFQLGWFASVLGAAREMPWLGVSIVGLVVIVHLATRGTPGELALIGTTALVGAVVDTWLLQSGLVTYEGRNAPQWLAPAWIIGMWANFAITLRHSLAWLSGRWGLATLLGAAGGPLAYWGAASLGAVSFSAPLAAGAVLSAAWAVAVPALFWVSLRTERIRIDVSGADA